MTEPTLEFLGRQIERVLDDYRDIRADIRDILASQARIEHELMEQRQDIGSLGRVMLRFESRLHDLEETS